MKFSTLKGKEKKGVVDPGGGSGGLGPPLFRPDADIDRILFNFFNWLIIF